jgi:hypothetical protein
MKNVPLLAAIAVGVLGQQHEAFDFDRGISREKQGRKHAPLQNYPSIS